MKAQYISRYYMITLIIAVIIMSSGCSIVNPYNTEFKCPSTFKGTCGDLNEAYQDSLTNKDMERSKAYRRAQDNKEDRIKGEDSDSDCETCSKEEGASKKSGRSSAKYEDLYKQSLYMELKTLIDEPKTPVIQPPKVMRVLLMGYTDSENQYLTHRYMYLIVTDPKWVISPVEEAKQQ